jgi:hypothetical protein
VDTTGDGKSDRVLIDVDGDGVADIVGIDKNGDGVIDEYVQDAQGVQAAIGQKTDGV